MSGVVQIHGALEDYCGKDNTSKSLYPIPRFCDYTKKGDMNTIHFIISGKMLWGKKKCGGLFTLETSLSTTKKITMMQGELGLLGMEQVRGKARPQERAALPTKLNSPNIEGEQGSALRWQNKAHHGTPLSSMPRADGKSFFQE